MKLLPGDIIRTNYGTGPFDVLSVEGGCACPSYLDEINCPRPRKRAPHMHIICCKIGQPKNRSYLNGYVWTAGGRLMCLEKVREEYAPGGRDEIIIEGKVEKEIQLGLF